MQQPQPMPPNYNLQYPQPQTFDMNQQQYQMPPYQQAPMQNFPQVQYQQSVSYQLPPPPVLYQPQNQNDFNQPQNTIYAHQIQLQQEKAQNGNMQPSKHSGPKNYINPLCGCTQECGICLISWCVPCALQYYHASAVVKATEGRKSFPAACCLECCGCCCINRLAIRKVYDIDGSCCCDCCLMFFCRFCASLQDSYEVKSRE